MDLWTTGVRQRTYVRGNMGQTSGNQAKTAGKDDRFVAAVHPQLGIDVVKMELHRSFGDE